MTDNRQSEALRLAEQYDYGDPVAHSNTWKAAVCNELRRLQHIESAALLALGMLWMTERDNAKVQTAFKTLRDALGSKDALRKGIEVAIEAGYEADHPPGADWWAGKKEHPHE